ncbi:NAD(P)H-binding protein [Janibacter cremeus]|uniref:NAD(P)-dependent oxidoreductase n=1 Tax=Janibacter cremeus TaxID=1285192 RepID=UPI0023F8FDDC|nr:NAD(P)H-binding protein [Janibacter cremeus]WEV78720.1 NAD(P)H-binding protein [Janibacter cremeus]
MSTIVILGGTGYAGGHIAREAVSRGHRVISYSRSEPSERAEGVEYRTGSLTDDTVVAQAAADADDLVVATHGRDVGGSPLVDHVDRLVQASIEHGARLSFVGGAGTLHVAKGGPRLVDTPDFHEDWKPEALAHAKVLDAIRQAPAELDWFYVSPAALFGSFAPGETTGGYRLGLDELVVKDDGSSEISGTDYATAYLDEIERGDHPRQRFTVGH